AGPPASTPFRLRELVLHNRLVADGPSASPHFALVMLNALDQPRRPGAKTGLRLCGDFATGARTAAASDVSLLELDVADQPKVALHAFDAARGAWPIARPIAVRVAADSDPDATVALPPLLPAPPPAPITLTPPH